MYEVRLVKIQSNHNNLRTNEIVGKCMELPEVGKTFLMTAPPLEEGNLRIVLTTEIKECSFLKEESKYLFQTQNSKYELHLL